MHFILGAFKKTWAKVSEPFSKEKGKEKMINYTLFSYIRVAVAYKRCPGSPHRKPAYRLILNTPLSLILKYPVYSIMSVSYQSRS